MKQLVLTDGSGNWFDVDKAEVFDESTRFDGHNRISIATGSQWAHQQLVHTHKGTWVLRSWSQEQGSSETILAISKNDAFVWLINNEYSNHLPETALAALEV